MSSVPQGRPAPAFQLYAASVLADLRFRSMNLPERGLYITLLMELWINPRMPSDPAKLAKVLGLSVGEVSAALPAVMQFYENVGDSITCDEHEKYRACLDERRNRQVAGGEIGARATNSKRRSKKDSDVEEGSATPTSTPTATPTGDPSPTPTGSGRVLRKAQNSTAQQNQKQSSESPSVDDAFVRDYDAEEAEQARSRSARAYAAASRAE